MDFMFKRKIEAAITSGFIKNNSERVMKVAKSFSAKINDDNILSNNMDNFYLKGGNAISVLEDQPLTGDFDFQFVPNADAYNNWNTRIDVIDTRIIEAMKDTVKDYGGSMFDLSVLECNSIKNIVLDVIKNESGVIKNESDVIENEKVIVNKTEFFNSVERIGDEYMKSDYVAVAAEANKSKDKRAPVNRHTPPEKNAFKNNLFQACAYVNYTIPGFILYRLVCRSSYEITIGEEKPDNVTLKSEIIDVSIPRVGSGEVYMSQKGIVTHFRKKNGFFIPGWGYHFYENINLLQEIELGISGSPQKKEKRLDRFNQAANKLIEANKKRKSTIKSNINNSSIVKLLDKKIYEPDGVGGVNEIYGYYFALSYISGNCMSFTDETNEFILNKVLPNTIESYFNVFLTNNPISKALNVLYEFKINDDFSFTVRDLKGIVDKIIADFNRICSVRYGIGKISVKNLSPYLYADGNIKCGFDYAVISVDDQNAYDKLFDYCKDCCSLGSDESIKYHSAEKKDGTAIITMNKTLDSVTRVAYVIIQADNGHTGNIKSLAEEMLKFSILESQRFPLTQIVQDIRKHK